MGSWEEFYKLLQKQEGYYRVILEIVKAENDCLVNGLKILEIKKLVKKRNILMSCIQEVENVLLPHKQKWKDIKNPSVCSHAKEVSNQLSNLSKLIKEILLTDTSNQRLMKRSMYDLKLKKAA